MVKKYSKAESSAYKKGFFAGLFSSKKSSKQVKSFKHNNSKFDAVLKTKLENARKRNLGAVFYNGKFYDSNFVAKPEVITKDYIRKLRSDYDPSNRLTDGEVADAFVRHMRRKYGVFNKDGTFSHMIGEE